MLVSVSASVHDHGATAPLQLVTSLERSELGQFCSTLHRINTAGYCINTVQIYIYIYTRCCFCKKLKLRAFQICIIWIGWSFEKALMFTTVVLVNTNHQIGLVSCIFFKMRSHLLFVIATVKTRHVLKRAWQELSAERYKKLKLSWGFLKKCMKTAQFGGLY